MNGFVQAGDAEILVHKNLLIPMVDLWSRPCHLTAMLSEDEQWTWFGTRPLVPHNEHLAHQREYSAIEGDVWVHVLDGKTLMHEYLGIYWATAWDGEDIRFVRWVPRVPLSLEEQ